MTAVPAVSYYGESATRNSRLAASNGVKPAPVGLPYVGRGRCIANSDTCEGFPAKGTEFCMGHLRALEKAQREQG